MSDLISRQDAIEAIQNVRYRLADVTMLMINAVKRVPSAQQWVSVSERLPDLWDERYLVSLAWGGVGVMEYKSTGFHNYGSFSPVPIETVTAWMPLPKPYERSE